MKPVSVAITVPFFPNIVQTYILNQLVEFRKTGIDFTVIANAEKTYDTLPSTIKDYNLLDDVKYVNTDRNAIIKTILSLPFFNSRYHQTLKAILKHPSWKQQTTSNKIKTLLRASIVSVKYFDIIHSHSMFSSYNYLFMKEALSIPLITTYHGQVPKGVRKLEDHKMKRVLDKGDVFIVNTNFAKNELIQLGCHEDKISMIPQGILLDNFPFQQRKIDPSKKIILLTVGRLSIEKGHHIALLAMKNLIVSFPTLEYHIVGHGPDKEKLSSLCDDYQLDDKVVFHGFQTGHELKQIFDSAHIFVLPSINTGDGYLVETQGVVLQEAQSSGIPVIGSCTGGIADVIENNETGFLYDEGDHDELSEKISRLINEPELYQKLSHSGRQDVETRFDIKEVCKKLLSLYETLLNKNKN